MSVRVLTWVFESSKSTGADRLVLLAIADAADDHGRNAYPSTATIARKAATNNRTVQRSIRALVDLGELKVSTNTGPNGTNRYSISVPKGWRRATPGGSTPPGDTPPPRQDTTPEGWQDAGVATDHRRDAGGVATTTPRGGDTPPEPSLTQLPTTRTSPGSRNAPAGFGPRIVRAYVEAGRAAGVPAPEESQAKVERSARSLLAQGYDAEAIEDAARSAAVAGWTDLSVQMQRDASRASPTAAATRESTTDKRVNGALEAGQAVAAQLNELNGLERKAIR